MHASYLWTARISVSLNPLNFGKAGFHSNLKDQDYVMKLRLESSQDISAGSMVLLLQDVGWIYRSLEPSSNSF